MVSKDLSGCSTGISYSSDFMAAPCGISYRRGVHPYDSTLLKGLCQSHLFSSMLNLTDLKKLFYAICIWRWTLVLSVSALNYCVLLYLKNSGNIFLFSTKQLSYSFFKLINLFLISWRLITLQYCRGFCHTLTWISLGYTCIPHPNPPSHLPLHPIPLGLPSAPGPSTCLMIQPGLVICFTLDNIHVLMLNSCTTLNRILNWSSVTRRQALTLHVL